MIGFFLYCSILFFPYFYIAFQVSMILFRAQTVCDGSQYAPRKTSVCGKRRDCKERRLTWMTYWYKSQIGTMSAGARYWSHNISKQHSYLNIVFPSRYLFSSPYFFRSFSFVPVFFSSLRLVSVKLDEVFPASFHRFSAEGKSFSAACLLRLWLLLSVDTFELFLNPTKLL